MPTSGIVNEIGRTVYGTLANRLTEEGRECIRRPLTQISRRLLGAFAYVEQFTFTPPITILLAPTVASELVSCVDCWDLKQLMPAKFREDTEMVQFLDAISQVVNAISCRTETMTNLADLETCPRKYLGHLAALIGYKLKNQKFATAKELRNQLRMAIEMYKIKGTYKVLQLAFYVMGLEITIYDLWTRDYIIFERQMPHKHTGIPPEFGGWETPEVLHLDDGYHFDEVDSMGVPAPWRFDGGLGFKSPHFDLVVNMNKIINVAGYSRKLFLAEYWDYLDEVIEEYTPVNTVPHFFLNYYGFCYENNLPYTITSSDIKTCLMNGWTVTKLYFDDGHKFEEHLEAPYPVQHFADQSFEAMLNTLLIIKLGTGNVGLTPAPTDTDIDVPVYTGAIIRYEMTQDYIKFFATVPAGTPLTNITELGIYQDVMPTPILTIESFCPAFDKPSAAILEIVIEVARKQL